MKTFTLQLIERNPRSPVLFGVSMGCPFTGSCEATQLCVHARAVRWSVYHFLDPSNDGSDFTLWSVW